MTSSENGGGGRFTRPSSSICAGRGRQFAAGHCFTLTTGGSMFSCVQLWKDDLLTWDPHDYGGVPHVMIPRAEVWTPDITLYNR